MRSFELLRLLWASRLMQYVVRVENLMWLLEFLVTSCMCSVLVWLQLLCSMVGYAHICQLQVVLSDTEIGSRPSTPTYVYLGDVAMAMVVVW